MKQTSNPIPYIFIILALFVILGGYIKHKKIISKEQHNSARLKQKLTDIYNLKLSETQTEDASLANLKVINKDNDTLPILDVVKNNYLIYRIFTNSCSPCIEDNFNTLDTINLPFNYTIIGDFYNIASYDNFIKMHKRLDCFMLLKEDSDWKQLELEKREIMYYFLVSEDLKATKVYAPIKEEHESTVNYLEMLRNNYY